MDITQFYNAALQESQWLQAQRFLPAANPASAPSDASSSFADTLKTLMGLGLNVSNSSILSTMQANIAGSYDSALLNAFDAPDTDNASGVFQILQAANSQNSNLNMLAALKGIQARNPTAASVFGPLLQVDESGNASDPFQPAVDTSADDSVERSEDALMNALLKPNSTGEGYVNALQALVQL
jgi:hypothetical protein